MKAPDKVYIPQYITFSRTIQELGKPIVSGSTEYIRKDALLGWIEEEKIKLKTEGSSNSDAASELYQDLIELLIN